MGNDSAKPSRLRRAQVQATIYPVDQAMRPNPHLPPDQLTMSMTDFAKYLQEAPCRLKFAQEGTPPGGFLNHTAGTMHWMTACRKILYMMPMQRSESTTQVPRLGVARRIRSEQDSPHMRLLRRSTGCSTS